MTRSLKKLFRHEKPRPCRNKDAVTQTHKIRGVTSDHLDTKPLDSSFRNFPRFAYNCENFIHLFL